MSRVTRALNRTGARVIFVFSYAKFFTITTIVLSMICIKSVNNEKYTIIRLHRRIYILVMYPLQKISQPLKLMKLSLI